MHKDIGSYKPQQSQFSVLEVYRNQIGSSQEGMTSQCTGLSKMIQDPLDYQIYLVPVFIITCHYLQTVAISNRRFIENEIPKSVCAGFLNRCMQ